MNGKIASLIAAAFVLASCSGNPDNIIPDQADWCYEFDFVESQPFALGYGYWYEGVGYVTDNANLLGVSYFHANTVNPILAEIGVLKAAAGDVSVTAAGNIFGIEVNIAETLPSLLPSGQIVPVRLAAPEPNRIGHEINITAQTSGTIVVQYLKVFGRFENPFPESNCEGFFDPTPTAGPNPSATNTPWPTSMPSSTPAVTATHTAIPTETNTPTPTPSWSPTPTPTPTAFYYLGPITTSFYSGRGNAISIGDVYWRLYPFHWPNIQNALARGVVILADSGSPAEFKAMDNAYPTVMPAGTSFFGMFPANSHQVPPISAAVNDAAAATAVSTLVPNLTNVPIMGATQMVGTPVGGQFQLNLNPGYEGSWVEYRMLLLGWPTPTPTPSNTPTASPTRTPTRTPVILPITQTPGGPTFTPIPGVTTPTPSRTFAPIQLPPTLPDSYITATPWGTPGPGTPTVDPSETPGPGTPTGEPAMTGTPVAIPGEFGDITGLGGNILAAVNNVFALAGDWLRGLGIAFTRVSTAWFTTPPTPPPGVPLCTTNPLSNEFCAILYIIRYTLLSGPVGSLIMPLATVVFDLFIVFMFIRMSRAILARMAKLTGI